MAIQKSFAEVRQTLIDDQELYNAFAASIKSALDECDFNAIYRSRKEMAIFIADRVIGKEGA